MNRLVIIGNGFDLAHGLPTAYCDFINNYWRNVVSGIGYDFLVSGFFTHEDNLIKTSLNFILYDYYSREKLIKEYNLNSYLDFKNFKSKYDCDEKTKYQIGFKSDFFQIINERNSQNWVDIENEYYYQLKKIVRSKCLDVSKSEEYWKEEQNKQVKKLNDEFATLKLLFENYLKKEVLEKYNFGDYLDREGNSLKFPEIFKPKFFDYGSEELSKFLDEFPLPHKERIENLFTKHSHIARYDSQLTFLNFNYTPTNNNYIVNLISSGTTVRNIHIHGFLKDIENPINFGFGDEMDDDYKQIENINDNEYLKNFKSFQYLHTSNYKKLLDFVDIELFQVYILGHSCGLSDRTLLNTIFEHQNCISIKVFFHETKNDKGEVIKDNYTEITQNISRHFNKKKLMREKIVNKTLCQPLPQIQLPKK